MMSAAAKRTLTILSVILVIAAGVVTLSYANWVHDRGERLFRQAETEFNRGQFGSAASLYEELVDRFPSSSRVDNALFRLGFISANLLNDPGRSLAAYRRLLELAPKSQLADEALNNIADLRMEAQDGGGALRTYQELIERFADDPKIVAQAYLSMARVYYRQGDAAQAEEACRAVLGLPTSPEHLAEAEYIQAQVAETLRRDPKSALKIYDRIVKTYPQSFFAPEAEQRVKSAEEGAAAAAEAAREASVYLPIRAAPSDSATVRESGLVEALRTLMAQQGVEVSSVKLMGFTGEAFKFFYSPRDRSGGVDVYGADPVQRVGAALGYRNARVQVFRSPDAGWKAARQALVQGYAVMTPFVLPPPNWAVLVGYDDAASEVRIFSPGKKYQAYSLDDFRTRWATPFCPSLRIGGRAGAGRYPLIMLGPRSAQQDPVSAARQALRDAVETARAGSLGDFAAGAAAFQALAEDLEKLGARQLSQEDIRQLDDWFGYPLTRLLAPRRAAREFLLLWAESFGGARAHIEKAAELYEQSAQELEKLKTAFEAARSGEVAPETGSAPSAIAQHLTALEKEITDELAAALSR